MYRLLIFFTLLITIISGCKKDVTINYSISGTLLESNSNPIPVKNYKLSAYQRDSYGFFGGVAGTIKEFQTDINGFFSLDYVPLKGTGLFSGSINQNPLSIEGIDTNNYKDLYFQLYPITANKDTNLNKVFLFKKIEKFVRKIQFNSALNANDTLQVITSSAFLSIYKNVYGPVPAGTLLLDTINQYKMGGFNLLTNTYNSTSTFIKKPYSKYFTLTLPVGDELYREHLLIYP